VVVTSRVVPAVVVVAALAAGGAGAWACASTPGGAVVRTPSGLEVGEVAVSEGSRITAGYLVARYPGGTDTLVGASSPAATRVSLHRGDPDGGMAEVEGFTVGGGEPLRLVPGGDHLMFEGLDAPLVPGDEVPLTLTFAEAGEVRLTAPVVALVDVVGRYDGGW
jgi:copper(I)-binding protein